MDKILQTEFSPKFVEHMQKAMLVSFHKYGPLAKAYPEKVDAIGSLMVRLRKYADTGNTEYLVDVANFAMIEFMLPRHPTAHFKAEDAAASPGRVSAEDGRLGHLDNSGNDLRGGATDASSVANMRHLLRTRGIGGEE